ncbi:VanW family protein [[Clostridium] dakarense]|uniref:VanW family protein n=1 Tax=Faecalimicrobium dakarense TaxID=1301100 RepID=UPI0004AEF238|nr:VanW family protein [[Clostridium] dakarense]
MKRLKIILLLSVGIFFLGSTNLSQAITREGKIHKNISIMSIDISGLTKDEAKRKVKETINHYNEVNLIYEDKVYKLNKKDLGIVYNIDESVEKAYNIGRDKDIISNIKTKVDLDLGENKSIDLKCSYNEKNLDKYINFLNENIKVEPINATIKLENDKFNYTKETYGIKIDVDKLKKSIILDVNKVFSNDEKIPTISIKPNFVYDELSKIDTVLGTYETHFNTKLENRVNNIDVAARATNNVIVKPYEEFSFNHYVNDSSIQSQFKNAPVIINGKLEQGLGGGICQVSSTMYNAALYAGLEITKVRNHSIPSAYVSKGRDATVATGNLDFRFKNKYNTPIFITHKMYDNKIVTTIYGNKEDKKEIEVTTEIIKSVPNKVKIKTSKELFEGEKTVSQNGRTGYKINTFRIYKGDKGNTKEFISESYYPPMDKVVVYGTKKKVIDNIDKEII